MQLLYRGQSFSYSPATLPLTAIADGFTRTLFYRGNTYRCQVATLQPIRLPSAINWRFAGVLEQSHWLRPAH